jgi:hypothetical protein
MIDYIRNILPRLRLASQKVDKREQLVDKTWVWVGFGDVFTTIHFLRDQRLLVTKLGDVNEGRWELISNDLIHISGEGFNRMLNHGIIFQGLLLLQIQGIPDHIEVFYDHREIPDGDVINYIETHLPTIESKSILSDVYPYTLKVEDCEICFNQKPSTNSLVSSSKVFSGRVVGLPDHLGVELIENKIIRVYYFAIVETNSGYIELEIENCDWENPKGKGYIQVENSIPNGEYTIISMKPNRSWKRISFKNGEIDFVGSLSKDVLTAILILLVTGFAALIIAMK